jgi:hypothetical protein
MTQVLMDRFQTFSVFSARRTRGCGEYLSTAQEISLLINVGTHHAVYGEPYPSARDTVYFGPPAAIACAS